MKFKGAVGLCYALLFALLSSLAWAGNFAALTIRPFGAQAFDLSTGVTTLADGGSVIDLENNVRMQGTFIRYLEGSFVELHEAEAEGSFGVLQAGLLHLDLETLVISASAEVRLQSDTTIDVQAESVHIHLSPDIAVVRGEVRGVAPQLQGASMLVDMAQRQALLIGPYHYNDGPVTLRSQREGELLSLQWGDAEAEGLVASTNVAEAMRSRLLAYLH